MKTINAVGGAVALALIVLAGWFIVRANPEPATLETIPIQTVISTVPEAGVTPQTEIEFNDLDRQLVKAVSTQDPATVESHLDAGANPNVIENDGDAVLRTAIARRGHEGVEIVRLLVDHGADVNALDKRGYALLPLAAEEGRLEIVQILLDAGADVDGTLTTEYATNATGLALASQRNYKEIAELLIAHGADVNHAETGSMNTPLGVAANYNNSEIVEILLENGADHTLRNNLWNGQTPLHTATRVNALEAVQALLEGGADVDALTEAGQTPLIHLMSDGYRAALTQIAPVLLDAGADPDHQDSTGNSALHYAAMRGTNDAVPILIDFGADVNLENNEGQTPLDVAHNDQIVELLREAGAVEGS